MNNYIYSKKNRFYHFFHIFLWVHRHPGAITSPCPRRDWGRTLEPHPHWSRAAHSRCGAAPAPRLGLRVGAGPLVPAMEWRPRRGWGRAPAPWPSGVLAGAGPRPPGCLRSGPGLGLRQLLGLPHGGRQSFLHRVGTARPLLQRSYTHAGEEEAATR